MSHTAHVQHETQQYARDLTSGVFRSNLPACFIPLGILGYDTENYAMPRKALALLAAHLGGPISEDIPPFFVACADGMVLVITMFTVGEYMGGAVLLTPERMAKLDRGIYELWHRLPKDQDAEEFFKGTAFQVSDCLAYLPATVEAGWKSAFC